MQIIGSILEIFLVHLESGIRIGLSHRMRCLYFRVFQGNTFRDASAIRLDHRFRRGYFVSRQHKRRWI